MKENNYRVNDGKTLNDSITWKQYTLYNYLGSGCSHRYNTEDVEQILSEIAIANGTKLQSNNPLARMAYHYAMVAEVQRIGEVSRKWSLLTVTPGDFTVTFDQAKALNVRQVSDAVAGDLAGLDYVAVIEMAYYPEYGFEPRYSFHLHALIWKCDRQALKRLTDHLAQKFQAYKPAMRSADLRPKSLPSATSSCAYLLKPSFRQYRPYTKLNGQPGQRKQLLQPGQLMDCALATSYLTLPELLFAGGEGVKILRRIDRLAMEQLQAHSELMSIGD